MTRWTTLLFGITLLIAGMGSACAAYATFEEAYNAAWVKHQANKPAEAREDIAAALALTQEGGRISRAYLLAGNCYRQERNLEKAMEQWRLAAQTPHGQPRFMAEARYNIGYYGCYERGKQAEAREELQQVLQIPYLPVDQHAQTYYALGLTYLAEKDYPHAREQFTRALQFMDTLGYHWEIHNLRYHALVQLAGCYRSENNLEQAKDTWRAMLEVSKRPLRPGSYATHGLAAGMAYWGLGQILYDEKRYADAREAFAGAIQNWSYVALDAQAQLYIGHCYADEKDYAHAREAYEKLLKEPEKFRQGVPAGVKAEAEKRLKALPEAP